MLFGARWGAAKWGIARWGFPIDKTGTNWSGAFEADGVATFNIGTKQGFVGKFASAGVASSSFAATLKYNNNQFIVPGVCAVSWKTTQKFVGAFQINRRDQLWKRYYNGLAVDGFPTDWDGGQQYWKDGLATDWISNIPEVVFFEGFKGKEFKYYYNGLQTDGLDQDGSQSKWYNGLAYDFLDTPLTFDASIFINGQASLSAATQQAFAARFNLGGSASVQFGTQMSQVGRPTMAAQGSMTVGRTISSMLASFACAGVANVSFISGIGSVKITCVDTGVVGGGGPPAPAISFLYDAPYSY